MANNTTSNERHMTGIRKVKIQFRFEVKQTGNTTVEVEVPTGNMALVTLNPEVVDALNMSVMEVDNAIELAEQAVLQEIVIKR